MKHILLFCTSILLILFIMACGAERNIKRGEKFLALGEYYEAGMQFQQAYRKTPSKERDKRGRLAEKMALCFDKINFTPKAIAAYNNAIRYQGSQPLWERSLGKLLLKNGNYKEAEKKFLTVLDSLPQDTLAKQGLLSAQQAAAWKEQGSRYIVKRMTEFYSRRSEYSPAIFGEDFNRVYFTSTRKEAEGDDISGITGTKPGDIFVSERNDKGKWSKPEPVQGGLNTAFDEGACCFSPDRSTMYFTQCATDPSYPRYAKIMTSQRSDASWGKAQVLEITRDTLSSFAHPAVSPDGQWLYFVSDMPGGKGGLDIWRVRLNAHGLGGVENLGAPINTPGNEMFPTFRPNGDLYFSSDGKPGLGGLDIYIAKVNKQGRYEVSHPGYPLNSQGDDFGMTFEGPYNRGYFSSNRNDAKGWDHIYSFENPEIVQSVKGWVYERDGYELPAAQVYIVGNDGTNQKVSVLPDGSFRHVLTPGVTYLYMATCKGYLNHQEEITVKPASDSKEYVLQFPLPSITAPVLISNIFYDLDKANLRPESTKALDELTTLLQENPNVTIELSAHCDYRGSDAYNKNLAQRRAQTVVDYLIAHGIAKDRLIPVGYGKEKPKTIRKKLTETYNWLKEGDVLSEEFIKKQTKAHQEICNQLNRRTEFIVRSTTYGMFDENGKLKEENLPRKENTNTDDNNGFDIVIE